MFSLGHHLGQAPLKSLVRNLISTAHHTTTRHAPSSKTPFSLCSQPFLPAPCHTLGSASLFHSAAKQFSAQQVYYINTPVLCRVGSPCNQRSKFFDNKIGTIDHQAVIGIHRKMDKVNIDFDLPTPTVATVHLTVHTSIGQGCRQGCRKTTDFVNDFRRRSHHG